MAAITWNHKNDCHGSTVQDRDLQQKLNANQFGPIFTLNKFLAILDTSH